MTEAGMTFEPWLAALAALIVAVIGGLFGLLTVILKHVLATKHEVAPNGKDAERARLNGAKSIETLRELVHLHGARLDAHIDDGASHSRPPPPPRPYIVGDEPEGRQDHAHR